MGKPFVLSLNPGIGSHLSAYSEQGFDLRLVLEPRTLGRQSIDKNLKVRTHEDDPRQFYNRKQKGVDDLLQLLGLTEVGALDVLDVTTNLQIYDDQRRSQNLFDVFGIARRLEPKIVIAFAPQEVAENKNRQRFNSFLDYLRYDHLRDPELRKYFVTFVTLDTADFGSAVRKRVTLVIGVRSDIAAASDLYTDQGILSLLPKSKLCSPLGDVATSTDPNDDDFWFLQTAKDVALKKAIQLLPKEPSRAEMLSLTPRQKKECGYKKSHAVRIARASFGDAIPDPTKYHVIHPKQSRLLTNSELENAFGFPRDWKHAGNEVQVRSFIEHAIPTPFVNCLLSQTVLPLLQGKAKVGRSLDNRLEKMRLVESLRQPDTTRRIYHTSIDIGFEASRECEGKEPCEDDFDFLFDANEINHDFIVYGPYDNEIGRRPVVGAVKRKVFQGQERKNTIAMIEGAIKKGSWTEQRLKESLVPVPAEMIEGWKRRGTKFQLNSDGTQFRRYVKATKGREAHWDSWRAPPMPSISLGWQWVRKPIVEKDKDGNDVTRHIKEVSLSPYLRDNPSVLEKWNAFSSRVTGIYRQLAFADFVKQAKFMRSWVGKQYHLGGGLFTSKSVQKYGDDMPAMGFHIDSGDENSGLTTITVIDEGTYEGGYFVVPRYRCAFRVGDGDVFVANSRQVHGVSRIEGDGKRLSVVSYSRTSIGRRARMNAYPIKSPRPKFRIDQYQIAIPSFKRDGQIIEKTLKVLESYSIDPKRVTIFMANEEERQKYAEALTNSPYQNLVIAQEGIMEVRNFMWNYYPEGTPVLFMDDDVETVQIIDPQNSKKHIKAPDLFNDVIAPGFNAMRENHAYIWGMYAAGNPGFMTGINFNDDSKDGHEENSSAITIGNVYIIGSFFGAVIRHDPKLLVGCADKEDHERSVTHFIKDGRVVRLDFVTVESAYYKAKGGLQETRTADTVKIGADYMLKKYPKYVWIRQRTSGAHADMWEVKHK